MIELIHMEDLAHKMGYASANSAFREWCRTMRITPVPGRRGFFDPTLVRRRLDEAQGLIGPAAGEGQRPMSLTEQRKARRAATNQN